MQKLKDRDNGTAAPAALPIPVKPIPTALPNVASQHTATNAFAGLSMPGTADFIAPSQGQNRLPVAGLYVAAESALAATSAQSVFAPDVGQVGGYWARAAAAGLDEIGKWVNRIPGGKKVATALTGLAGIVIGGASGTVTEQTFFAKASAAENEPTASLVKTTNPQVEQLQKLMALADRYAEAHKHMDGASTFWAEQKLKLEQRLQGKYPPTRAGDNYADYLEKLTKPQNFDQLAGEYVRTAKTTARQSSPDFLKQFEK